MTRFTRADVRHLNDEEFTRINEAVDKSDFDTVNELRSLHEQRLKEEQAVLAQRFVQQAKEAARSAEGRNQSDLAEFEEYMRIANGNPLAAMDLFFFNKPNYRNAVNALIEQKAEVEKTPGLKRARINYVQTAALVGERALESYLDSDESFRALLTTDAPGAANTIQTTVAQSIVFRAENIGNVLPLLQSVSIPYGDYEVPYFNKYNQAGYLAEDGTVPDYNDTLSDASDGIKKAAFSPRDFALGLKQSFRSLKKLSPEIMNQILDFMALALTSGMEYQAISGPGTGTTDSGMITVATSVTAGADVFEKFINARSEVASKNVRNIVAFGNARAIGEFIKLKVTNEAFRDMIVINRDGISIANTQLVEVPETIIVVTAGNPDTTTVVLGDPSHYLVVNSGQLQEYTDMDPENLQKFTAFHMLRDGGAIYSDSFAKITLELP